jgi:cation diffusion facilitator family transporter
LASETQSAVVAAIVANVFIAISKLAAAAISGSAAMLSESIHSIVDAGNDVLMLYGLKRSRAPPNEQHPFGHGHELYFWTLIVGMLIFGVGGGMSIGTGYIHIAHNTAPESTFWNYAVIGMAAVFEGWSWLYGLRAFRKEMRGRGIIETIRISKNPTTFSVLLEDSAALLGLFLAFIGIYLASKLNAPWIDGAASILIGVLLCFIALIMVYESKGLLVGEGVEKKTLQGLREVIVPDPAVECINRLLTMYLGPDEVMLVIEVRFRENIDAVEIRNAVARIKQTIRDCYPRIQHVFFDGISPDPADVGKNQNA